MEITLDLRTEKLVLNPSSSIYYLDFLAGSDVKRVPTMWETWAQCLAWEDLLEKETATHSSTLAWKIPRMEEPGGLQFMGSQRIRHD